MQLQPLAPNPLRDGLTARRSPDPCAVVIFGATGDLTARKLIPALYNLAHEGQLPAGFAIVGFGRRAKSHAAFRAELRQGIGDHARFRPINDAVWDALAQGIFFQQGDYRNPGDFQQLSALLERVDRERGTAGRRLFYMATPPGQFAEIIGSVGAAKLNGPGNRFIIEKPFGRDLATARELNRTLTQVFAESQIYRIDHYLGKETVQNILVLRFANEIFEHLWNQKYVDHVQITVAETLGVEARGGYYDQSGALRDMVQNHMMQLLALVAMEPPTSLEAEVIRDEKVKVLRAIRPLAPADVAKFAVRAQYAGGSLAGQAVPGYLTEKDVPATSRTETYVALKLFIDNWRWAGAPRQAVAETGGGDRGAIQSPTGGFVRRRVQRAPRNQRARHPHPARRGDFDSDERESARHGLTHPAGEDGFPVRRQFWRAVARRL